MAENDFREPSDHGTLARWRATSMSSGASKQQPASAGERSTWMGSSLWRSTTRH
jgi:hypothetical protein